MKTRNSVNGFRTKNDINMLILAWLIKVWKRAKERSSKTYLNELKGFGNDDDGVLGNSEHEREREGFGLGALANAIRLGFSVGFFFFG